MKPDIHPEKFETVAHCACGNEFPTTSTKKQIRVTLCSNCHPIFTGKLKKYVDAQGRIEKFNTRYQKKSTKKSTK